MHIYFTHLIVSIWSGDNGLPFVTTNSRRPPFNTSEAPSAHAPPQNIPETYGTLHVKWITIYQEVTE